MNRIDFSDPWLFDLLTSAQSLYEVKGQIGKAQKDLKEIQSLLDPVEDMGDEVLAVSPPHLNRAIKITEQALNKLMVVNSDLPIIQSKMDYVISLSLPIKSKEVMLQRQEHARLLKNIKILNDEVGKIQSILIGYQEFQKKLCSQIQQGLPKWDAFVARSKKPLYLPSRQNEIERSLQYNPDGTLILHFTKRTECDDPVLGKGAYKLYSAAVELTSGKRYVSASQLKDPDLLEDEVEHLLMDPQEIKNLELFKGVPGFIQLAYRVKYIGKNGAPKERLIFERYDGNLHEVIFNNQKPLSPHDKQEMALQLLTALAKMHEMGYLHRDLKLENILARRGEGGRMEIAITDLYSLCGKSERKYRAEHCTTVSYASPEYVEVKIKKESLVDVTTEKHDVWAIGLVLHQLFITPLPWSYMSEEQEIFEEIQSCMKSNGTENTNWYPEPSIKKSINHLIWEMLQRDPNKRLSSQQALARLNEIIS